MMTLSYLILMSILKLFKFKRKFLLKTLQSRINSLLFIYEIIFSLTALLFVFLLAIKSFFIVPILGIIILTIIEAKKSKPIFINEDQKIYYKLLMNAIEDENN